jgi:GNAT superfamily N-acetyltransferase
MRPKRLTLTDDFTALHQLLVTAFAYMEGRIDPPSSLHRMTPQTLARDAAQDEVWALHNADTLLACMILTRKPDHLYLGKLATAQGHRGKGLARQMIAHAEARARALHLPTIQLQTRIELTENHTTFQRLGFREIARTIHPGYDRPTSLTFAKPLTPQGDHP